MIDWASKTPFVVCWLALLASAGCSKSADEIKASRAGHSAQTATDAAAVRAAAPVARTVVVGDAELVSAVASDSLLAGEVATFDLRFRLLARPEVAQPLQIELVAVPATDAQFVLLQLSIRAGDGINLTGDAAFEDRDLPTGERARHTLNVIPRQAGVLQIFVSASATTTKTVVTRQFAVPLIAFGAQPAAGTP